MSKPTVGIFGLTGCAGDQLVILNCEDELLQVVDLLDIRDFVMASSARDEESHLNLALVEGAVVTPRDRDLLEKIRARSDMLIALGACAISGGIPGMSPGLDRQALFMEVYGDVPATWEAEAGRPLSDFVKVDGLLPGCPIEKAEFLAAVSALLQGNAPRLKEYPVCAECRLRENRCLLTTENAFCCGPVTRAGCGARCPTVGTLCIGCRGLSPDANLPSAVQLLRSKGYSDADIAARLGTFSRLPDGLIPINNKKRGKKDSRPEA